MGQEPAHVLAVPTLKQLYPNFGKGGDLSAFTAYPLPPTEFLQLDSPRIYLHSSGSTSLPKAILINEQYLRYMERTGRTFTPIQILPRMINVQRYSRLETRATHNRV